MPSKVPVWRVAMDVPLRLTAFASFGLWGLSFLLPWLWGRGMERFMGYRSSPKLSRPKIGLASAPVLLLPRLLPFLGSGIAALLWEGSLARSLCIATGVLVWLAASAVMYPIYAAPLEMLDGNRGLLDSVVASTAKSARTPLQQTLLRALGVACVGALAWIAAPFVPSWPKTALLTMFLIDLASPAFILALVAHAWSGGVERFGDARTSRRDRTPEAPLAGPLRQRLAGAMVLALAPLAVVLCTLFVTLMVPSPARTSVWATRRVAMSDLQPNREDEIAFPTPSGLAARRHGNHVTVSTADGGGAGEVRLPCLSSLGLMEPDAVAYRERYRGAEVWTYRTMTPSCENRVSFTDEGVRVDDTPYDRIALRWGGWGVWVALVVGLLCALAAFDQLRWLGRARNLDAAGDVLLGTVAIEGRVVSDGPLFVQGSRLTAPTGLRVDLGEHGAISLPPGGSLALLHPVPEPLTLVSGAVLSVIMTLEGRNGSPFRDANATPTKEVRVVLGTLARAREAYLHFASRRMAITGLLSLICSLTVALFALSRL